VAAGPYKNDAKPVVVSVLVGDALDQSGEHLPDPADEEMATS